MITDARRVCELLVGLPEVTVLGVDDRPGGPPGGARRAGRPSPGVSGLWHRGPVVRTAGSWSWSTCPLRPPDTALLAEGPLGVPGGGVPDDHLDVGGPPVAAPRQALTDRAGRWVTVQVGRYGRSVAEVAGELGCAWHTVNDAVVSYGEALDGGRRSYRHGDRLGSR